MANDDVGIVPIFKTIAMPNEVKSREAKRPVFDDMEVVEIRFAGDRNRISVFPAHEISIQADRGDGTTGGITYAERFSKQYQQYKSSKTQTKDGTPLEELTFLSASQRSELKAFNIYTAETLADLDGTPLKSLGQGGRDLKNQARAYLEHAAGFSENGKLTAENAALKAKIAELEGKKTSEASEFDSWSEDDLKEYIKTESGHAPRGNPAHKTLVRMADELKAKSE